MFSLRSVTLSSVWLVFFFNDTATTEFYTLSLHDALPILIRLPDRVILVVVAAGAGDGESHEHRDRKSTRLNSSHTVISYAVFCLKKKKKPKDTQPRAPRPCDTVDGGPPRT